MKGGVLILVFVLLLCLKLFAQNRGINERYELAYDEISQMLDGKTELSIQRAVFISEWAFLDGNLDYERDFRQEISRIAAFITKFIEANRIGSYKTAKQMAICEYLFNPWSGNNNTPYNYDLEIDYDDDSYYHRLVAKVLKTHKGQCRSLPWLYKLIAVELKADAYIAYAPMHCFIMYKDEDNLFPEDWVNVEIAAKQYQPTFWIKEHFEISDLAIKNGTYLTPLTDKETVARQLSDLAYSYIDKYRRYDEFSLKCAQKSLQYHPMNPNAIIIKWKSLEWLLRDYLAMNGNILDAFANSLILNMKICKKQLEKTNWTYETEELKKRWSKNFMDIKSKQK